MNRKFEKHQRFNINSILPMNSFHSSSSSSSSTKRRREDDSSSDGDGTISSNVSLSACDFFSSSQIHNTNNGINNNATIEGYPTTSFKRMKIEHPQHTELYSSQSHHQHVSTQQHPQNYVPSQEMMTCYEDAPNLQPSWNSASQPAGAPQTEYSSLNKLLGGLHRDRKHRLHPSHQENHTVHSPPLHQSLSAASAILPNMNHSTPMQNYDQSRRHQKRSILQTHSSLY